jgi:hypothetical protein
MAGLDRFDPAIHVLLGGGEIETWMPGTSLGMTELFERPVL